MVGQPFPYAKARDLYGTEERITAMLIWSIAQVKHAFDLCLVEHSRDHRVVIYQDGKEPMTYTIEMAAS